MSDQTLAPRVARELHAGELQTRLPAAQGKGGGGIDAQLRGTVQGLVDQLGHFGTIAAAPDARTHRRGENVGDRLAQVARARQAAPRCRRACPSCLRPARLVAAGLDAAVRMLGQADGAGQHVLAGFDRALHGHGHAASGAGLGVHAAVQGGGAVDGRRLLDKQIAHDGQVARADGVGRVRRYLVCGDGSRAALQGGRQGVGRMVVLHHGAVGVMRGVDGGARFGGVKFLRVQRRHDDAACQVAARGKDDDLFAHGGRRPGARAAGASGGPFQPFGGEGRPELDARLGPFDLGNGAQADQVLQQAEEVGQVGVHAMHVAEVRVRMHAGAG